MLVMDKITKFPSENNSQKKCIGKCLTFTYIANK